MFSEKLDDGHVYVCGCGALGLGEETTHITTPLRIPGLRNIVAVKASTDYSCAIDEAGRLFIWGLNNFCGILGNGSTDHHYNPILIEAPGSANTHLRFLPENLSVGNSFSLAFLS
ncbi:putative E3 ubiquitin-protein ligase HERC4 [Zancudomyces culisetae]|uniref:Putative E3 ubiquitin-protein ligase HERC4 n=1 Tax=Zancudomyces culisetae TaxID=1213189 RepID=A0A1R1PIP2_ZANCU|nr:putative E3 ubiquitin-protein ligase HERC4 [Zancudomyces culisetae]OMH80826.1 putative E3 ubiquitin-protein ligase HERC4 [Zancudomyces culisetae]|eukprot:OMH79004.1 putative E3 ubiquitin-protein ligase HERC4 [Zancudomyces culisetae]